MFTFLVISSRDNFIEDAMLALASIGAVQKRENNRLFLELPGGMDNGWIAIEPMLDIQYDYEEWELFEIRKIINKPYFYLVEGGDRSISISNLFVCSIKLMELIIIDNDHGGFFSLDAVKSMIARNEDWLHKELTEIQSKQCFSIL